MSEKHFEQLRPNVRFEGTSEQVKERATSFFIRGYVKPTENPDLQLLLQGSQHWAYVWHDKDDKEPHCHIIVRMKYNNTTPFGMAKILCRIDNKQNWHFSILHDKYSSFDYLYHRDVKSIEAGKHKYADGDVFTDDIAFFTRGGASTRDNEAFYTDLVERNLSYAEMGRKYGRDYMKNYRSYDNFRKEVYYEEYAQEIVSEASTSNADWLDICFTVVKKALHPYLAYSNNKPSDKFLYEQITRLFEDQIINRFNKGELKK